MKDNTDVTIELEHPFKFEGEKINNITLSRPTVANQLTADGSGGSNAEKEVALFASIAKQPPALIECVDLKDYGQLQDVYSNFLA